MSRAITNEIFRANITGVSKRDFSFVELELLTARVIKLSLQQAVEAYRAVKC
jgi:hypothetical protein